MNLNGGKFFGDRYTQYVDELTAEGTLAGQKLTPSERKEGFKKRGDKIAFNTFVNKVMAKKSASTGGGGIGGGAGGNGNLRGGVRPAQRLLGPAAVGMGDEPVPPGLDSLIAEIQGDDKKKRQKSLLDYVKQINNKVGTLLKFFEKDTEARKEDAAEQARLLEKQDRAEKERKKEGKAGKIAKPAFLSKLTAPLSNIFNDIVKTFLILLAGWGIDKIFKWLGDPANKQKVEDFKEFITVALPKVLKGILAIVALGIGAKILKFAIMIGKGAALLLKNLLKLGKNLIRFAAKNPKLALALGVAGLATAAVVANQAGTATVPDPDDPDKSQMDEINEFGGMTGAPISGDMLFGSGGGMTPRGTDTVPAMLSPGEFIMSRGAVDMYGADTLASMNADGGGTNRPIMRGGTAYAKGGGSIEVKGTGNTVEGNLKMKDSSGKQVGPTYSAISGTYAGMNIPQSARGSTRNAPIPDGNYKLMGFEEHGPWPGLPGIGDWSAYINNSSGSIGSRKGLMLHSDIGSNGTLGCIGVELGGRAGTKAEEEFLKIYKQVNPESIDIKLGSGDADPNEVGAIDPSPTADNSDALAAAALNQGAKPTANQLMASSPSIQPIGRGLGGSSSAAPPRQSGQARVAPQQQQQQQAQGLFSPIDQNNLSMLVVKSMYNIIE